MPYKKFICKNCKKKSYGGNRAERCIECHYGICQECGSKITKFKSNYSYKYCSKKCRFIVQSRMLTGLKGIKNFYWKGGRIKQHGGYIKIYKPDYPNCDKKGYILEHRFIMEQKLGRLLKLGEEIHHKNQIKDDNRIENLDLVVHYNHLGLTSCPNCHHQFKIR